MALYKGSIRLAGIGSFPDQIQYMSQDEYNALSEEAKMNGTTYGIVGNSEIAPGLLEFVEKLTISGSSSNSQKVSKTYDYTTYVIATCWNEGYSEPQGFIIASGKDANNYIIPSTSSSSYNEKWGIDASYIYPNSPIWLLKSGGTQNVTYNVYVYKVNLPEDE